MKRASSSKTNFLKGNMFSKRISLDRQFDLPRGYGDNKIVLMVRDPWTFFSYWEINRQAEDKVRNEISKKKLTAVKTVLRVYELPQEKHNADNPEKIFDIELKDLADSWYIHMEESGKECLVDIGILCAGGDFFVLSRSNIVQAPLGKMQEESGVEDRGAPGKNKVFGIFTSIDIGRSSFQLK